MAAGKRIRTRGKARKKRSPSPVKSQAKKKRSLPAGLKSLAPAPKRSRERDEDRKRRKAAKERREGRPLSQRESRAFFRLGGGDTRSIAQRAGVTEATVKRWARDGIPAKRKRDVRRALDRSAAAKTAVRFREGYAARRETIGAHLHGKRRADRMLLESMIDSGDARWLGFEKKMRSLGFSSRGTRDEFFSPKEPR